MGLLLLKKNAKWQQSPFNGNYTSSIFVSQDPVAIDCVGTDFLINEPTIIENNYAAQIFFYQIIIFPSAYTSARYIERVKINLLTLSIFLCI